MRELDTDGIMGFIAENLAEGMEKQQQLSKRIADFIQKDANGASVERGEVMCALLNILFAEVVAAPADFRPEVAAVITNALNAFVALSMATELDS